MAQMKLLASSAKPARISAARDAGPDYGVTASPSWREVDWPAHVRQAQVGGRRLSYAEMGEGGETPVLLIHGLGGCWQNWLENIPRLAQERRVIAVDLPGFGDSEMPAEDISISRYARTLDELGEQLELDRFEVVGNSMGGFIAAEMAIRHPERVESLTVVSPAGISTTKLRRQPLVTSQRVGFSLVAYTAAQQHSLVRRPRSRHYMLCWVARHPSLLAPDFVMEGMLRGVGKPGFIDALEALLDYDFVDRLPEISCPTLIVWGEEDMLLPVKDADEYERLIPNTRKVVMEDTGHVAMMERPQTFNDCLVEFLAETPAAAGRANGSEPHADGAATDAAAAAASGNGSDAPTAAEAQS